MTVAVVGAGNFGTVIANIVASNGFETFLWMRDEEQLADIDSHRENRRYLPGHSIHEQVIPTTDIGRALTHSDLVFVTVPSASFRQVAALIGKHIQQGTYAVSATKGVEHDSFKLMSEILSEELPPGVIGVLSGPNLAEEIALGKFAGTVIASPDPQLRLIVQQRLSSSTFRVYSSPDVYGVELGGALKNVYAIICGIATALDVGQNAVSLVITRSLIEMSRFAQAMEGNPYTFLGLAGVGDLVATCTSPHSRNFQLGYQFASGLSLDEAMNKLGKLAEGVNTLKAVYAYKQRMQLYMPLADALYRVLVLGEDLKETIFELMTGEQKDDVDVVGSRLTTEFR